ncbi:Xaa-His dipeptidase [Arthrobacter globiformis NBRC 12137]|uniref:Cytosol non-specific dipeptidase n=1 Tax=Arthrobacter globiformis (strain ATCC 8010 / DSM 20124 / JCM 1332 / NBRC 12137 / NCIMB 8907 / NRRL B-2979 / 168) TaxID=1077972 RepID=H0QPQ3_ARTG1|nr:beta-Ala-His dipeptidase [Arthrobacter globiformis]GAB14804.1 Xaa-His dipeptidase [Arthrobacter globiformis NBRC 12137]
MTSRILDLEPKAFFKYFEEISNIPRGSYHEQAISNHLAHFARERGLEVSQDDIGSLLIKKPGTEGYESAAPLVFHGHMDMVLAKDEGVDHDMLEEGVRLRMDGDFITGSGTTLGADNGVGVAFMMAILGAEDLAHPPIQAIITVQEEVGKAGALHFDVKEVTGRRLIDFNWHDPNSIFAGCAGDISAWFEMPLPTAEAPQDGVVIEINVHGLEGGHSEFDIHHGRGNAIMLIARLLRKASDSAAAQLLTIDGGVNRYVIPNAAKASVFVPHKSSESLITELQDLATSIKAEYRVSDPHLLIEIQRSASSVPDGPEAATAAATSKVARVLNLLPNGVQSMSLTTDGLVESSNTVAQIEIRDGKLRVLSTIPSAVSSRKYEILDRIRGLADIAGEGATVQTFADCPEWPFQPESPLLAQAKQAYKTVHGRDPEVEVSHSSLELGIFASKLPGVEMISVGPEAFDVHTTKERLNYKTVQPVWDVLVELLRRLDD